MTTPMAKPTRLRGPHAGSIHQPSAAPPIIEPRLKKHDASAGMPKMLRALSMPMTSAASETNRMNGYITRTMVTVRANSSGL